jgi:hypothetical protein
MADVQLFKSRDRLSCAILSAEGKAGPDATTLSLRESLISVSLNGYASGAKNRAACDFVEEQIHLNIRVLLNGTTGKGMWWGNNGSTREKDRFVNHFPAILSLPESDLHPT